MNYSHRVEAGTETRTKQTVTEELTMQEVQNTPKHCCTVRTARPGKGEAFDINGIISDLESTTT